jgi:plasmid stabilization system protein ParE
MNRTLRIIERARSDVDEIFNWLGKRSVRGAIVWYLAFRRKAADVAASPEIHPEAPEGEGRVEGAKPSKVPEFHA